MFEAIGTALSGKIAETIKDPKKIMFILLFVSAFFLVSPEKILQYIGVNRQDVALLAVILFLSSLAYFIYDAVSLGVSKNNNRIKKKQDSKRDKAKRIELIEYFNSLNSKERNIIKRYHKFNRSVIALRLEGEEIFDFLNREIIVQVDGFKEEIDGIITRYYFRLNDLVKDYILNVFQEEALKELKNSQ